MKKKINSSFFLIAVLAVILTMTLASVVFYELFQEQVSADLKTYAHVLCAMYDRADEELLAEQAEIEGLRITIVDPDGTVQYDTNADIGGMSNHGKRPEISEAMSTGEGQDIRTSETMSKSTFYYAVRMADGQVLRVAKEARSIWAIVGNVAPFILIIAIGLMGVCGVLGRMLTTNIITPIREVANHMNDPETVQIYQELEPFVATIQEQHKDILKSARMRQEFTANVSHELKTPLTSISGYAELIENGMAKEREAVRFAGEIRRNANRLLTLINDTIRLSELDAAEEVGRREEMAFEKVDLYQIAVACGQALQINAEQHGVTLTVEGESCCVRGSRMMLEEVVYNLCDNAIRYNNPGGFVKMEVGINAEGVVLVVKDNGIGIPAEHQERIFERFYRVDKSRSKVTGGTGLGLAIVKHIVTQHGGTLRVDSEIGKGTEISVAFQPFL